MQPFNDEPLNILVIDDDPTNLLVIEKTLTPHGCRITSVRSGQEGLDVVTSNPPDIILLDVMMPEMDGFEVCQKLKSQAATRLIPVVLITALQERQDRIAGIEAGADDFISKPIERMELIARVKALGKVKRLNDDLDHAEDVVMSFARAVEAKDGTTGDHCDRLIRLCTAFGKSLGLSAVELKTLERASVLHDVGKIGIPDTVLLKPGKLTPDEWVEMRRHPIIGETICKPLRSLRDVLPLVRHHHEKWNGTGYPDGLKG
ncbi:MAG: response regulator, partial [Deltaproteobacteria bacterium]|nr:response regulator [Deltaproteobacteria bacterium]